MEQVVKHLHQLLNIGQLQLKHPQVGDAEIVRISADNYEIGLVEDGKFVFKRRAQFKEVERTLMVWFGLVPQAVTPRRRWGDKRETVPLPQGVETGISN